MGVTRAGGIADKATAAQADAAARGASPLVRLRGVACNYGTVAAVHPTDLDITAGDFVAILGPSGCGKSTLLRTIGGFIQPDGGTIEIDSRDVTRTPPERRPVNMVFQGYGLFPHLNVWQNVAYGLRIARRPAAEIAQAVEKMLSLMRLLDLQRRPVTELSGGQQQRVALARALILKPKVLLLDEPLAALDLKLRQALQEELRQLHEDIGGTFIFVTHDQTEALALANRIAVMEQGRIVQVGDATDIYRRPRTEFVARFIGDGNFLPGHSVDRRIKLDAGLSLDSDMENGPVMLVLRPEDMRLSSVSGEGPKLRGTVSAKLYLGSYTRLSLDLGAGRSVFAHLAGHNPMQLPAVGDQAAFEWTAADQILIPA